MRGESRFSPRYIFLEHKSQNTMRSCRGGSTHYIAVPRRLLRRLDTDVTLALQRGRRVLRWKRKLDIVVFNTRESTVRATHTGGYGLSTIAILIYLDCSARDIRSVIARWLPAAIHHELAHIVRNAERGYGETLLETMVSEGVASYAEHVLNPPLRIPYTQKIKGEDRWLRQAQREFPKRRYDHSAWYFGTDRPPRWIGYRLGYRIAEQFMRRYPGMQLAELVRLPAKKVYQRAMG